MAADVFGNLVDWGRVLKQLEELSVQHLLDEHQPGLARILRWGGNWRLTQWVLAHVPEIHQASDILIAELVNILTNEDASLRDRVSAAQGIGHLLPRRPQQTWDSPSYDPARVVQVMRDMLGRPMPPLLHNALDAALEASGSNRT